MQTGLVSPATNRYSADHCIEMQDRPTSLLKTGHARETKILFQRPPIKNWKRSSTEALKKIRQKKLLMAYENKPNCCKQFRDQVVLRIKHLVRNSRSALITMVIILFFSMGFFGVGRRMIKPKAFPEFSLEKLKHPLYQTSFYDPQRDQFYGDFQTSMVHAVELESFMQFARYTNIEKKTGRKIVVDGEIIDEKVRSYDPGTDMTSPAAWVPMQCMTNVTHKYQSKLIAKVNRGTQLEADLWHQTKQIMNDLKSIQQFYAEMKKFFEKAGSALGGGGGGDAGEGGETAAAGPAVDDSLTFKPPEDLINEGGGAAPNPHPIILEKLGDFNFAEFQSEEELFSYVQQDGYGWDPEKPAVCFAFQVHENEAKNKYELELYFRDQWPKMYMTYPRLDQNPGPLKSAPDILSYTRQAYNGANHLQVFAANSILQRRISPDAEIIMMTLPYKIREMVADSYLLLVIAFTSIFHFAAILPLIFYIAFAFGREKEQGFAQRLFENGLNRFTHFFAWLILYTLINLLLTLLYTIMLKKSIFSADSFGVIFLVVFMGVQSLFPFLWAINAFLKTTHMAIIGTGFIVFVSYFLSFAFDQVEGKLDHDIKKKFAISPLTAIKNTIDTYSKFHTMKFPMTWESWDTRRDGWSLKLGLNEFISNFIIYLAISFFIWLVQWTFRYYKKQKCTRQVIFENSNKGMIEISGIKSYEGRYKEITYNLKIEKSQICCLIGTDSAQKTELIQMLAGICDSHGQMLIRDSDFFVRSRHPNLKEFLVYRSQDVVLDEDLTAVDHLNLFAHLRGDQKFQNTHVLCNRLLPEKTLIKEYTESQRQFLQTLIALSSENSRIVLLNEPTRGLGLVQRNEIIKMLWRFKKERYIIIQTSDAELVNILADSVAKVLNQGIETIDSREVHNDIASYKLIVEVQDGKPSESLLRYLSKDVPDLTLEYHTDLLTYYILPNINKKLLQQKALFLENNMSMLGLIDFEIVSLPAFEVAQRNIPLPQVPAEVGDCYEDSFDGLEYNNNITRNSPHIAQAPTAMINQRKRSKVSVAPLGSEKDEEECYIDDGEYNVQEYASQKQNSPGQLNGQQFDAFSSEEGYRKSPHLSVPLRFSEDPDMKEFMELEKTPIKKPAQRRDYFYDFKQHKAKRKICLFQFPAICCRSVREHWHNKLRCLIIFIIPILTVTVTWHCVRFYHHMSTGSLLLSPEILPHKQPLLVNKKTQIGGQDTKKWIDKLPMSAKAFEATYIDTSEHKDFYGFRDALYEFSTETISEQPYSQGAYQFFEMDEDRHKYKILSYMNLTAPYSTSLFPQFIIESVMKTVLDDDEFEFKTKVTALPTPKETLDRGSFMTFYDHSFTFTAIATSDLVGQYAALSWEAVSCIFVTWFLLNCFTIMQLIKERTSGRKAFFESHGQSQFSYWLARYIHDLAFYLPVSFVAMYLISKYEPQMEAAPRSILFQPFATLPFLYVFQNAFHNELRAIFTLLVYSIFILWILPYITIFLRLAAMSEKMGDNIFKIFKILPMQSSISSMLYNSAVLKSLATYRDFNTSGVGQPIEVDEMHAMNAQADVAWIFIHTLFFWFVLLVIIEWQLPFCCLCTMKRISDEDNKAFFSNGSQYELEQEEDESSEIAQILGDNEDFSLRFHVKQKPENQLAYLLENFGLYKSSSCFGLSFCFRRDYLISDLSAQIQAGSKYAIVADSAHGKTMILNSLNNRQSAYKTDGIIKKQIGRQSPIYMSQRSDVLLTELTLEQNISFFTSLGSVNSNMALQMIVAFGLFYQLKNPVKNISVSEKHLIMLILTLAGSNRTVILDEPFQGLTHDQTIKLVKIIRQKHDCTLIVTAKSKAELELLQPQAIMTIRENFGSEDYHDDPNYILAVRLKLSTRAGQPGGERLERVVNYSSADLHEPQDQIKTITSERLKSFIAQNFTVFEKLRGKKRAVVVQVVQKLMARANILPEVSQEIGEMVHEDLQLHSTSHEIALKCELIISLYILIDSLCKRFGEVHLEYRQDDYAVLRVFFNEVYRLKGIDDSYSDQNPAFSSIVEFVNDSPVVRDCTNNCYFMSARNSIKPRKQQDSYNVKIFVYSVQLRGMQRMQTQTEVQQQFQWWSGLPTKTSSLSPSKLLNGQRNPSVSQQLLHCSSKADTMREMISMREMVQIKESQRNSKHIQSFK